MQAFTYQMPSQNADALIASASAPGSMYIAGGTDLVQLMKDEVARPTRLIDLAGLNLATLTADDQRLHIQALARMSDVAANPDVIKHFPVVSQALLSAASPQLRNMGTIGGNLLQRTRCGYFRDPGSPCNKRVSGSGCPAIGGINRMLAILGGSEHCIATHPSDLPVALAALDAVVELRRPNGATREVKLTDFHRLPGDHPDIDTVLRPGELITAVRVDGAAPRSSYLKVRDRASFEFAVVSVAAVLDMNGSRIGRARLAAGGVAHKPWRLTAVETALNGADTSDTTLRAAAAHATHGAVPQTQNGFKLKLLQNAVFRALRTTTAASAA